VAGKKGGWGDPLLRTALVWPRRVRPGQSKLAWSGGEKHIRSTTAQKQKKRKPTRRHAGKRPTKGLGTGDGGGGEDQNQRFSRSCWCGGMENAEYKKVKSVKTTRGFQLIRRKKQQRLKKVGAETTGWSAERTGRKRRGATGKKLAPRKTGSGKETRWAAQKNSNCGQRPTGQYWGPPNAEEDRAGGRRRKNCHWGAPEKARKA